MDARRRRPTTLPFHGEATSLVIGEAQASRWLRRAQDPILLEQVVNDRLLLSIDPTGKQQTEERERRRQRIHGASLPKGLPGVQGIDTVSFDQDSRGIARLRLRR
jgi:hypothetical protein